MKRKLQLTKFLICSTMISKVVYLLLKLETKENSAIEHFVEGLLPMIIVDQQNMAFPDLLILMAQKNSGGTSLHPVRDLFRSYDIDKRGVINADEITGK